MYCLFKDFFNKESYDKNTSDNKETSQYSETFDETRYHQNDI